jgi:hypothetical protein
MSGGMEGMALALFAALAVAVLIGILVAVGLAFVVVRRTGNRKYWWLAPAVALGVPFAFWQMILIFRWF